MALVKRATASVDSSHAPAEGAAFADEVLLADELLERARAHPGGQWLVRGGHPRPPPG